MNRRTIGLARTLAVATVLCALPARAVPVQVPYSGQLAELGELVDGTRNFTFRICRNTVCAGADQLYMQTINNVQVSNGAFSVLIGSDNLLQSTVFKNSGLLLKVQVGSTALGDVNLPFSPYAADTPDAVLRDGTRSMTGDLDLGTNDLTNAGALNAGSATLTGALNAASATLTGALDAGATTVDSLNVSNGGITNAGAITGATNITASGTLTADNISVATGLSVSALSSTGNVMVSLDTDNNDPAATLQVRDGAAATVLSVTEAGNLDTAGGIVAGSGNVTIAGADGRIPGINPTTFASVDGAALTNLDADNLASGTVPLAQLSGITSAQLSATAGITNGQLANSAVTVTAGNALTGGGSVALGASTTLDVATGAGLEIDADAVRIAGAAAGAGLSGGGGVALDVNTGSAATTGLEINLDMVRIAGAAAGNGLGGGGGSALAVNTGSGLEVDTDAVRIATSAAGTGLTGGGGAALSVVYGTTAGSAVEGNQTAAITAGGGLTGDLAADALGDGFSATLAVGSGDGIMVNADDVAVNVSAIAGTNLEDDGSNNLRIAAAAAGNGLAGGGASVLSVNTGNGIQIASDAVALGDLGTGDWIQSSANDIRLNNTGSELRILGTDGLNFGTFDVGVLTAGRTYTFGDADGTVWTSGNDGSGSGLDADLLDGFDSAIAFSAAQQIYVSTAGGFLPSGTVDSGSVVDGSLTSDDLGTNSVDADELASTTVAAGSYGSATSVGTFTVDGDGRLTAAADVAISGVTPGGAAGGDLAGTYPNPTIATGAVDGAELADTVMVDGTALSFQLSGNDFVITDTSAADVLRLENKQGTPDFAEIFVVNTVTAGEADLTLTSSDGDIALNASNRVDLNAAGGGIGLAAAAGSSVNVSIGGTNELSVTSGGNINTGPNSTNRRNMRVSTVENDGAGLSLTLQGGSGAGHVIVNDTLELDAGETLANASDTITFASDALDSDLLLNLSAANPAISSVTGDVSISDNALITGTLGVTGNLDANGGLDVTGDITVTGNVDGVDVAAHDHSTGTGQTRLAAKDRRRTVQWFKDEADAMGTDTTSERVVAAAADSITVTAVFIEPAAGLTANDTDFATITVQRRDQNGANPVTVATITTEATGGSGDWVAFDDVPLTLSGTASNLQLTDGQKLTVEVTKTGAGVIVPVSTLQVEYTVD